MSLLDEVKEAELQTSRGIPTLRTAVNDITLAQFIGDLRRRVTDLENQKKPRPLIKTVLDPIEVISDIYLLSNLNKILLYSSSLLTFYPISETGLLTALGGAVAGDTVWVPSAGVVLTAGFTMPANVNLIGLSLGSTLTLAVSGTMITLAAGSKVAHLTMNQTANNASSCIGFQAPGSGEAVIENVVLTITQSGAGGAYGVRRGNGDAQIRKCTINASSTGGEGFAGDGSVNSGHLIFKHSTCIGSTFPYKV